MLKIAGKIGGRMIEVDNALKKLKEAVEEDQLSSAVVPQDGCVDWEYQENNRFRTHVRKTLNTIIDKLLLQKSRCVDYIYTIYIIS